MRTLSQDLETLESMNAHRQTHAAEIGQLIPRNRRGNISADFTTVSTTLESETSQDNVSARSVSWPTTTPDATRNRKNGSLPSPALPPDPRDVPFRVFVENHPLPSVRRPPVEYKDNVGDCRTHQKSILARPAPVSTTRTPHPPHLEAQIINTDTPPAKACPSAWSGRVQEQMEEKTSENKEVKLPLTDALLSHHNKMTRRINPGFEVLPVGTLIAPVPVKEWGDASAGSTHNQGTKRISRKLQKRDRSGSGSRRTSSEDEQ